jgi:hypothetical protein
MLLSVPLHPPAGAAALAQRDELCRADPASRKRNAVVATETASDLGRLARQMARVDDCRTASQFHAQENPEPGAPVDLVARRAQVEEAAACRRSLCHSPMPRSRPIPDLPALVPGTGSFALSRSAAADRKVPKADARSFRSLLRSDTQAGPTRRCPPDGYVVSWMRVSQCNERWRTWEGSTARSQR